MRTIIEIPADLLKRIDSYRKSEDISRAEAIRRAVKDYLDRKLTETDISANQSFGMWKNRVCDGLSYEKKLRDEWS